MRVPTIMVHFIAMAAAGAAAIALGTTTACYQCRWDTRTFELGIDVDLHAVVELDVYVDADDRWHHTYLAVGAAGTVVRWGFVDDDDSPFFVEVFEVGEVDLNAVVVLESNWWVVGDDGMAAVSADLGRHWTRVDLAGSTADLRAIVDAGVGLVVVGDGVILVEAPDGTWTEATPLEGDWGDLRDVHWDGTRVYAVGLGGVVWSAADPRGIWIAEDLGIDVDLNAITGMAKDSPYSDFDDLFAIVGANGTYLTHGRVAGWTTETIPTSADLIA